MHPSTYCVSLFDDQFPRYMHHCDLPPSRHVGVHIKPPYWRQAALHQQAHCTHSTTCAVCGACHVSHTCLNSDPEYGYNTPYTLLGAELTCSMFLYICKVSNKHHHYCLSVYLFVAFGSFVPGCSISILADRLLGD